MNDGDDLTHEQRQSLRAIIANHRPRSSAQEAAERLRNARPATRARRDAIVALVEAMSPPMTVRQVFYQATVHGIVEKTEKGYGRVQDDLVSLRDAEVIDYERIVDNTRRILRPTTYLNPRAALETAAHGYRKFLWADAECDVHFWIEKDVLAGVIEPIIDRYDVPLFVARGYASTSFLYQAAGLIERPTFVYHLGDFDPSGQDAAGNIYRRLREMAVEEIEFEQLAVTEKQIETMALPTRPTKQSDSRAAGTRCNSARRAA
jgi:hypothetical protein